MSLAFKCHCGCTSIFLRVKAHNVGVYCSDCGKWSTWLGKENVAILKRKGYVVQVENYVHDMVKLTTAGVELLKSVGSPKSEAPKLDLGVSVTSGASAVTKTCTKDPCPVCISGVPKALEKHSDLDVSMFSGALVISDRSNNVLIGAFEMKYCPSCGRALV